MLVRLPLICSRTKQSFDLCFVFRDLLAISYVRISCILRFSLEKSNQCNSFFSFFRFCTFPESRQALIAVFMSTSHQHRMAESIDIPPLTSTSTNLQKSPGASLHQQTTTESPTSQNQKRFLAPPQHHTPDSVLTLLSSVLPFLSVKPLK